MSPNGVLERQIVQEEQSLALQMAILRKRKFVVEALIAFVNEMQGDEGRPWKELKAELKIGEL